MSHAEAVHALEPAAGATAALVAFVSGLSHTAFDAEVRHYARVDRKSTRLNSSHIEPSRMPSSA